MKPGVTAEPAIQTFRLGLAGEAAGGFQAVLIEASHTMLGFPLAHASSVPTAL